MNRIAIVVFLVFVFSVSLQADDSADWQKSLAKAEAAFNSVAQQNSIPLFEKLSSDIETASLQRQLSVDEGAVWHKCLDYLGQVLFNMGQTDKSEKAWGQLIQLNPSYQLDENYVSGKMIEFFNRIKTQSLGAVSITGSPSGALIKVDNRSLGKTDIQIFLSKGEHALEISKPGFLSQQRKINVTQGTTQRLQFKLEAAALASKEYTDALAELRNGNLLQARALLDKAISEQPGNPMIRSAFGEVLFYSGSDDLSQSETEQALASSGELTNDDRLLVEARYRIATYDWQGAADRYQKLQTSQPGNEDYSQSLAMVLLVSGKIQAAQLILDQHSGPRFDLLKARMHRTMGGFEKQMQHASAAGAGQNHLSAESKLLEADALIRLNRFTEVLPVLQAAKTIYESAQDTNGGARVQAIEGKLHMAQKEYPQAEQNYQSAIAVFRDQNSRILLAETLFYYGKLLGLQNRNEEAGKKFEESLTLSEKTNDVSLRAEILVVLSNYQTDIRSSIQRCDEALALYRGVENKRAIAEVSVRLGDLYVEQLNRGPAKSRYEEAIALARELSDPKLLIQASNGLGEILLQEKDMVASKAKFEEAASSAKDRNDEANLGRSLAGLAEIMLSEKDYEKAKTNLEEALALFRKIGDGKWTARVLMKQGILLRDQLDLNGSREKFVESLDLFRKSGNVRETAAVQSLLDQMLGQKRTVMISLLMQGYDLLNAQNYEGAESKYQEALVLAREMGDKSNQVGALVNLGFLLSARNNAVQGIKFWEEGLVLAREIQDGKNESLLLYNLSVAAYNAGDETKAQKLYDESISISGRIGEPARQRPW